MKKWFVVIMVLCAVSLWATSVEETQEGPVTVGIWGAVDRPMYPDNPDSIQFYREYLLGDYDVDIVFYAPGESGAEHPIVLEVAAGTQPDTYLDYLGRTSIFANANKRPDHLICCR